jgi:DNA-binding response OmpR family regulator
LIDRDGGSIRLAILDVLMPRRNGRQVCDHLRARHPGVPVLFCSGYSAEVLPSEAAVETGAAILQKPYTAPELLAEVHRCLAS